MDTPRHTLLVMRHAKAEPFASTDHARVLTDRGRRDAADTGAWLAERGWVPTHAYVSTSARTVGTWEEVRAASGSTAEAVLEEDLYDGGPETVLEVLREAPEDAAVVIYVGHNPTAAYVGHALDDGRPDPAAYRTLSQGFPTASVAVFEVPGPWGALEEADAHLADLHRGRG